MTDLRVRLQTGLHELAGQPGVALQPPASSAAIERAELRLGRALPEQLRTLLTLANGLSVKHGQHQILGVEPDSGPDLVEFNAYETWKYAWPDVRLERELIFEVCYDLNVTAFAEDGETVLDGMLVIPEPLEPSPTDLVQRVCAGYVGMAQRPLPSEDAAVHAKLGDLRPGDGVFLGPRFFITGEEDPRELVAVPLEQALRMAGDLSRHVDQLPPNTLVVAPLREHDEHGRERWRWVTDSDLPGLAERYVSGTPVSRIEIDPDRR